MRINATPARLNPYGASVMARQIRPTNRPADSIRFGVCPVCATGGALVVGGLVTLGLRILGKSKDQPKCVKEGQAGNGTTPPLPSPPPTPPAK